MPPPPPPIQTLLEVSLEMLFVTGIKYGRLRGQIIDRTRFMLIALLPIRSEQRSRYKYISHRKDCFILVTEEELRNQRTNRTKPLNKFKGKYVARRSTFRYSCSKFVRRILAERSAKQFFFQFFPSFFCCSSLTSVILCHPSSCQHCLFLLVP